ncbi:MAG: DAK2 domain-containing protein [Lachnospiraceae bacterium]|nr:DAK2 domain-containing protein [Lachnospiraceae bacterium]
METRTIDTELLVRMIVAGAKNLDAKKEWINELNVFPVPDGDTGTNMCMTIFSAIREMEKIQDPTMRDLSKAISSGSLRGARGNSGVILSQLLRGFAKVIADCDVLDKSVISEALLRASETAYNAVMKPKEGTILTVAKAAADKAQELADDASCTMEEFFDGIISEAERILALTPDMLPVLKQAGVVDAGGQGLLEIFHGVQDAYLGIEGDYMLSESFGQEEVVLPESGIETDNIVFGYCTEFIINLDKALSQEEKSSYRSFLNSLGDSIVMVAENDLIKTHVHTNDPGLVLQEALTLGSLSSIKIDNMREEHQEKLIKNAERLAREQAESVPEPKEPEKEIGFIAVSIGEGMNEVFMGLGADYLIEGGQTMNPSTEDMLEAISQVNAATIFIFPNNKNIILAANQAAALAKGKKVVVIPTTTVPQGITALINFVPEAGADANEELMNEVIGMVKTGQVTYAIRDTEIDDWDIKEGDFMGIGDSSILSTGTEIEEVVRDMIQSLVEEDSSFICIYYGEEIDKDQAETLGKFVAKEYPECEVEIQYGGQPIYYYIVSVE